MNDEELAAEKEQSRLETLALRRQGLLAHHAERPAVPVHGPRCQASRCSGGVCDGPIASSVGVGDD
eukprot:2887267-Karenia_brevis.AAC.1